MANLTMKQDNYYTPQNNTAETIGHSNRQFLWCEEYGTCTPEIFNRLFKIDNREQKKFLHNHLIGSLEGGGAEKDKKLSPLHRRVFPRVMTRPRSSRFILVLYHVCACIINNIIFESTIQFVAKDATIYENHSYRVVKVEWWTFSRFFLSCGRATFVPVWLFG